MMDWIQSAQGKRR